MKPNLYGLGLSELFDKIRRLVTAPSFLYSDDMADPESLSLEELVRQNNIVDSPLAALDLESGMVLRTGGKLKIVISVAYENSESGPTVIVETVVGLQRFGSDAQLDVWHVNGQPFFIELPPEEIVTRVPNVGGGSSTPPAHDAAGIVPVWRGPKQHK